MPLTCSRYYSSVEAFIRTKTIARRHTRVAVSIQNHRCLRNFDKPATYLDHKKISPMALQLPLL